jgi:hypothetical protein
MNPQAAYLYGRFVFKVHQTSDQVSRKQTMGLSISCDDGKQYTFRFLFTRDVQVIEVPPSTCSLSAVMYTGPQVSRSVAMDPKTVQATTYVAGRAYYMGDYFASGFVETNSQFMYAARDWSWDMSPADDRYDATTADLRRTFVALASLPTEDRRLFPRTSQTKRGQVVIDDPGEPPMTPARVARVAPFIKRSYASPPECERACSRGACLPFRGESGPAMTCVNRCRSDEDCPEGLACNCPGGGVGCRAIAEAPGDRMAKICLSTERGGQRR